MRPRLQLARRGKAVTDAVAQAQPAVKRTQADPEHGALEVR